MRTAEQRLSREEIVVVARRLLAEEGVDGLTMRRLGDACGVQGPALYWHFTDKDELLGLIVDSVTADLEAGTGDQAWDERLVVLARSVRRLMVEHRGLAIVAAGRYTVTDHALGGVDEVLGGLVDAGFTHREALAIYYGVLTFATGFVIYETSNPVFQLAASAPRSPERRSLGARLAARAADHLPHVAAASLELSDLGVDELFDRSITALVQGWAARLPSA